MLDEYGYGPSAAAAIVRHTAATGTPAHAPGLDPEDEQDAELVFTSELTEVPFDSPAWDRYEDVCLDAELLSCDEHPWPLPAYGDDDREYHPSEEDERWLRSLGHEAPMFGLG
jgi:hypothetical protein